MARLYTPTLKQCRKKYEHHYREAEKAYAELRAAQERQRIDMKINGPNRVYEQEEIPFFVELYAEHHEKFNEWDAEFDAAKIRENKPNAELPLMFTAEYPPHSEDYTYVKDEKKEEGIDLYVDDE